MEATVVVLAKDGSLDWSGSGDDGGGNRKKRVESRSFQKGKLKGLGD